MPALVSKEYGETVARLRANAIIQRLAVSLTLTPLSELAHDDGTPRFEFMLAANRRFADTEALNEGNPAYTADEGPRHIGAIAEALLAVRADTRASFAHLLDTTDEALVSELIRRCQAGEDPLVVHTELTARTR
jgi:hypothetical protein